MTSATILRRITFVAVVLSACAVRPAGEDDARDALDAAGRAFAVPFAERERPPLPADAPCNAHVARALAANGTVEAAFHRWAAALEQVPIDATQRTNLMVGVEHRFAGGDALDRTGLALANDAMNNLVWPGRLASQGEAALARARVAAAEYDAVRVGLARDVAIAYHAIALRDAELALVERLRTVVAANVPSVAARVTAGAAAQTMQLDAEIAVARIDAELARLRTGRPSLVAALVALTGDDPWSTDPHPPLAAIEPIGGDLRVRLDATRAGHPELEARRQEQLAATAEVEVRTWQRTPEFSLSGLLMGDGITSVGGMLTLPFLRADAIDASVRQAEALARATEALARQTETDVVTRAIDAATSLTAIEAEVDVLAQRVLPRLQQSAAIARATWSTGEGTLADWAMALTAAIDVERTVLRLRAAHATTRARLAAALGTFTLTG